MDQSKLAEWLVIGFKRAWLMKDVLSAAGLFNQDIAALHEQFRFMPPDAHSLNRPVRAFVAAEWPKLNAFLCTHEADAQKMLSVIPQIVKLKAKGVRGMVRSVADQREQTKTKKEWRAHSTSSRLSLAAFRSNQRSAWGVCKA